MTSRLLRVKLPYNSKILVCSKAEHLSYWSEKRVKTFLLPKNPYPFSDARSSIARLFLLQHYGITEDHTWL